MADYRLYCLDGDGHIGLADWIQANTDEEALQKARGLRPDARECEVWLEKRLVGKISANGRLERAAD